MNTDTQHTTTTEPARHTPTQRTSAACLWSAIDRISAIEHQLTMARSDLMESGAAHYHRREILALSGIEDRLCRIRARVQRNTPARAALNPKKDQ